MQDKNKVEEYIRLGTEGTFRFTSNLQEQSIDLEKNTVEVELIEEGSWRHPAAPNGVFIATKERISTWVKNFKDGIMGNMLPLDFAHSPDSKETPGWIVDLYEINNNNLVEFKDKFKGKAFDLVKKKVEDGKSHLFATLKITEPTVLERIKNGSLCFISGEIQSAWEDPKNGQKYDVIRGAALTNYPYLKNLVPICVNFEEIISSFGNSNDKSNKKGDTKMADKEKKEAIDVILEDKEIDAMVTELEKEHQDAELEEVPSEDGTAFFANGEKYGLPPGQKAYGFKPTGAEKTYGVVPKINVPPQIAKLPKDKQKVFLKLMNQFMRQLGDPKKAMMAAMKQMIKDGMMEMEDHVEKVNSTFVAKFEDFMKNFGKEKEEPKKDIKLEEVMVELDSLKIFKKQAMEREDMVLLSEFKKLTPALKSVLGRLLSVRETSVKLEDGKEKTVRDLTLDVLAEFKANPAINLFEVKSDNDNAQDITSFDSLVTAYMKEHPGISYRDALIEVSKTAKK